MSTPDPFPDDATRKAPPRRITPRRRPHAWPWMAIILAVVAIILIWMLAACGSAAITQAVFATYS